ncbi:MAG: type III PLP-dependent enzyme [Planctomycetota bacterium]
MAPVDPRAVEALAELGCRDSEELAIGGIPVRDLARRFGTPLYAYDALVLRRRLAAVAGALPEQVSLLYSVKANPSARIARLLVSLGAGLEIASAGELCLALAAGAEPGAIHFAGPGKTEAEIAFAIDRGPPCFHAESLEEIDRIRRLSGGRRVRVALRVHPERPMAGARMRMSGPSTRFGFEPRELPEALAAARSSPSVELVGLHVYGGTQVFDADSFSSLSAWLCGIADRLESEGAPMRELDLGGGFGVPTYVGDSVFDLSLAADSLRALAAARPDRRYFVELGRYLAAPAGIYLASVVSRRESEGGFRAVLDGGLHQCALAAGALSVLKRAPLCVHATRLRADPVSVLVQGPLCTPADSLPGPIEIPPPSVGDLLAILNAGAYGLSFSPSAFLSHPRPAEVLVDGGEVHVLRPRGAFEDALLDQEA